MPLANPGETKTQPRERVAGLERDRFLEGGHGGGDVYARQRGEAKDRMRSRLVRGQRYSALGCVLRPIGIAERQPELGKPGPGACVTGLVLDRLQQLVARSLELEVRLQRIRQRDPRRGRGGASLDGLTPVGERIGSIVERDGDDRAQGVRVAVIGIAGQRLLEIGACLVHAPGVQQQRRPPDVESRIAFGGGNLLELREGIPFENRRIVERPLHRVPRPRDDASLRGATFNGSPRLVADEDQVTQRIVQRHASFKDRDERAILLDPHEELRALDRGVDKRRADVERPRLAREEENRALDQVDQRPSLLSRLAHDPLGVLVDDHPRVVDKHDRRAAALAGAHRVAAAHVEVDARWHERGSRGGFVLDLALDVDDARGGTRTLCQHSRR